MFAQMYTNWLMYRYYPWVTNTLWWHGHSSELIFISQKLFQILWWLHIISFIFFKDFAGKSKFIFNLDSKIWGKFVCFDLTVVVASSSAPEAELLTLASNFKSKVTAWYLSLRKFKTDRGTDSKFSFQMILRIDRCAKNFRSSSKLKIFVMLLLKYYSDFV